MQRNKGFIRAKEFKDNGGKLAGCLCSYTPQEVLDAAGIATVGLCGTSNETIPDAEKVLPKNLCPLIKSTYGFAYSEKCPYTYFSDIIIGETTCDGKKKMYELLNEIKETYVLHLPQSQERSYAKDIWYEEVRLLKGKLEEKFELYQLQKKSAARQPMCATSCEKPSWICIICKKQAYRPANGRNRDDDRSLQQNIHLRRLSAN